MIERIVSNIIESNVFVISNENFCFIVDAGAHLEQVEQIVGNKTVEGIILTHGHYDHCFFAREYAKKFGCKIFASVWAKEYLSDPEKNYSEGHFKIEDFSNFEFLTDNGEINLPHFKLQYFHLGGHSKSDILLKFENQIFVGDVIIGRDIGRMDLIGGGKKEMISSLQKLERINYQIMHCGHGPDSDKAAQDNVIKLWLKFLNR